MEYENRNRPRWYQLFGIIFFAAAVIYAVLVSNPYLYSGKKYKDALAGKKEDRYTSLLFSKLVLRDEDKLGDSPVRGNWQRAANENSGETRDRRYVETKTTPILLPEGFSNPQDYKWTGSDIILFFEGGEIQCFDNEAKLKWSFSTQMDSGKFLRDPLVTKKTVTFVRASGRIFQVNRETGKLIWSLKLDSEILSDMFLWKGSFYFVRRFQVEDKKGKISENTVIQQMNPSNGEFFKSSEKINLSQSSQLSFSERNEILYVSSGERLVAIQIPSLTTLWQKTLSSDVVGPVTLADKKVLTPLKEGKIKFFKQSNGTDVGEVDLERPVASPMGYIPIFNRASVVTDNGYLHVIDIDGYERVWRFDLNNENETSLTWSARLSGNFIEELSMKWRHKGWTLWSPCVKDRICIYNPDKGQIVGRVMLSGSLASDPIFSKHGFSVLLKKKNLLTVAEYTEKPYYRKNPEKFGLTPKPKPAPQPPAKETSAESIEASE